MLHQRRDDFLRRLQIGQRVGYDKGLEAGQRIERNLRNLGFIELFNVHTAVVGQRHGRRAEVRRVRQ